MEEVIKSNAMEKVFEKAYKEDSDKINNFFLAYGNKRQDDIGSIIDNLYRKFSIFEDRFKILRDKVQGDYFYQIYKNIDSYLVEELKKASELSDMALKYIQNNTNKDENNSIDELINKENKFFKEILDLSLEDKIFSINDFKFERFPSQNAKNIWGRD